MMRTQEIRTAFLNFFKQRDHEVVASASLVPADDKTLLFTNAGMVPFKDVFLGIDRRSYLRATSAQRCVRAGGKHNDLDNVGYTARHHTFFEMLGNFSFGDYFKHNAIEYAWELVTKVFGLPPEKLWVTVFEDDDEAYAIWAQHIGVSENRISRIGGKDNFWQMGDVGPCGPCSEIFYDHGEHIWGGPPGSPDEHGDRYIEIWNLVFMQYDRQADGELVPLPRPSVDTGMGLERIAAILQGVHSNYDIDLFANLIAAAAKLTQTTDLSNNSLKVIADHIRAVTFLLVDGVVPANEGRGYVLRRIMRRAIRHGYKLGQKQPFLYRLVSAVVAEMGDAYPDIRHQQSAIEKQIHREEGRFAKTIEDGMNMLEQYLRDLPGDTIAGDMLFKLYDTYGFPVDLTADIARERGLSVDLDGYDKAMQQQVAKSQASGAFKGGQTIKTDVTTSFSGYEKVSDAARVLAIFVDGQAVELLDKGEALMVLDQTTFYGESGGQVGDIGEINTASASFVVTDTQKQGQAVLHYGFVAKGCLQVGEPVTASIDGERRAAIERSHSATHLLHAALHQVIGQQATQKGSLVAPDRLRFDFASDNAVSSQQLAEVERLTNADILANYPVISELMAPAVAKAKGAMALFGEKYGDIVRVVSMGARSLELCGGTHVARTGEIGQVVITISSSVSSGVRRIEALTGLAALSYQRDNHNILTAAAQALKTSPERLGAKITQLLATQKDLQKQLKDLKKRALLHADAGNIELAKYDGLVVVTGIIVDCDVGELRALSEQQCDKHQADVVVLMTCDNDKVKLVVSVAKAKTGQLHAGRIASEVAALVGGKGGGRPDFAQAGGSDIDKMDDAIAAVKAIVSQINR